MFQGELFECINKLLGGEPSELLEIFGGFSGDRYKRLTRVGGFRFRASSDCTRTHSSENPSKPQTETLSLNHPKP